MSGDGPDGELLAAAWAAYRNAYVPYSGFPVGAALRGADGRVYAGANVENASYGLGRCAEQSAIQAMASAGVRAFDAIVVVSGSDPPASPCGACRQILHEFAPGAHVRLVNDHGREQSYRVDELLPHGFRLAAPQD